MKLRCVLIVTSSIDCTVDYIIEKYNKMAKFYRVNVDQIFSYDICIGGESQWVISSKEWIIEKADIYSIYYRKPRIPKLDEYKSEYHGMIAKDIISLINGIVDDFEGTVLTKPYILRKTENKIYQLIYAEKNKLALPISYIGNSNIKPREFKKINSIIKPITIGKLIRNNGVEIYQTNYFNYQNDDFALTPIYLQEYVNKKFEVRLTYIDGYFFPVRINSEDKLDWRTNYNKLTYSEIQCPEIVLNQCIKLLNDFDLKFGAFDFIVNDNEEWVFLEVNPNGQWQWLEQKMKLPISEKIVNYLIR